MNLLIAIGCSAFIGLVFCLAIRDVVRAIKEEREKK